MGRAFRDVWDGLPSRALTPGECWEWQGKRNRAGYGIWRDQLAHRLTYAAMFGPIPDGLVIMHTCDNPPCCNPNHLRDGTHADNTADKVAKGRQARGPTPSRQGERNAKAKLTAGQVEEIRQLLATGMLPREVAPLFGVCRSTVSRIRFGSAWTHLP